MAALITHARPQRLRDAYSPGGPVRRFPFRDARPLDPQRRPAHPMSSCPPLLSSCPPPCCHPAEGRISCPPRCHPAHRPLSSCRRQDLRHPAHPVVILPQGVLRPLIETVFSGIREQVIHSCRSEPIFVIVRAWLTMNGVWRRSCLRQDDNGVARVTTGVGSVTTGVGSVTTGVGRMTTGTG